MLLEEEQKLQEEASIEEKKRLEELKYVNELVRARKLDHMLKLETLAEENIKLQKSFREAALARMETELKQKQEYTKEILKSRLEDEKVESLKSATEMKLQNLHLKRRLEQEMDSIKLEVDAKTSQRHAERMKQIEKWRLEDEERAARKKLLLEKMEMMVA